MAATVSMAAKSARQHSDHFEEVIELGRLFAFNRRVIAT
jgi:hypothetical protein